MNRNNWLCKNQFQHLQTILDFFRKTNLNFRHIMFAILNVTLRKKYDNQGQYFRKFKRILPTVQVHISPFFYHFTFFFLILSLLFFTGIWARRIWAIWAKPFRHCLIKCKNTFTITTWDEWVKEIAIQVRFQVRIFSATHSKITNGTSRAWGRM